MKKYTTLLFDADNTLLDFYKDQKKAYYKAFEKIGQKITEDIYNSYNKINKELWHEFDDRLISFEELLTKRHELLFEKYNIVYDSKEFEILLSEQFKNTGTPFPKLEILLSELKKEYKLVIVTNGPKKQQHQRLKNANLLKYFDFIFISEEIGYSKPDKNFFDEVFKRLDNYNQKEYLIIGDSISSDVLGGINASIDTCWYNPNKKDKRLNISPTYEIKDFAELIDILS